MCPGKIKALGAWPGVTAPGQSFGAARARYPLLARPFPLFRTHVLLIVVIKLDGHPGSRTLQIPGANVALSVLQSSKLIKMSTDNKNESIDLVKQESAPNAAGGDIALLADLRTLIESVRSRVAQTVNAELTMLYWNIGSRIRNDILGQARADYGERVVDNLSASLTVEFGRGFDRRSLFRMVRFAELFPNVEIVTALRTQLSWTHWRELIAIDDDLKRDFYTQMCRIEHWS